MPRSLWRGSLSFGLVNVPVALVSAVRDLDVHFHQLHADTHARLEVKRVFSGWAASSSSCVSTTCSSSSS